MDTSPQTTNEPVDPDVTLTHRVGGTVALLRGQRVPALMVALGGGVGASARYAASLAWPTRDDAFPWTTLGVNVLGCAAIGVFMVLVTDVWVAHRLFRPFFATGVLGGFTTFSTYAVDVAALGSDGHLLLASAYLCGSLLAALGAVWAGATTTRRLVSRRAR